MERILARKVRPPGPWAASSALKNMSSFSSDGRTRLPLTCYRAMSTSKREEDCLFDTRRIAEWLGTCAAAGDRQNTARPSAACPTACRCPLTET